MPYTLPSWQDAPSTATPISSANLLLGNTAIQGLDSRLGMVETGKVSTGLVNAKGKLITSDNTATPTALAVGTDGQVLTADSANVNGLGLKWATPAGGAGGVPTSRLISSGTGLSGGGDLAADRTLIVVGDTTTQRVELSKNGTQVGSNARKRINLIEGSNVTITAADNSGSNQLDVTIAAATSGSAGIPASTVTAKGDLIVRDASAPNRLALSATTGQVLTVDPTNATLGINWAAPAVASVAGKTGVVTLVPADVGAVPSSILNSQGGLITANATPALGQLVGPTTNGQVLTCDLTTTTHLKWATPAAGGSTAFVTLTDAATITTDASLGNNFRVTLGGSRTLAAPTNLTDGQRLTWEIIQDSTGGRFLTFASIFVAGFSIPFLIVNPTANSTTTVVGIYDTTSSKIYVISCTGCPSLPTVKNQGTTVAIRQNINFTGTGVTATDDGVNNAVVVTIPGQNAIPTPESHNLVSWSLDPSTNLSGGAVVAGTVYLTKLLVPPGGATITRLYMYVTGAFTTPVNSQIGIYDSTGFQLNFVDLVSPTNFLSSTGDKLITIASTSVLEPFVWIGFVFNATTLGSIARGLSPVAGSAMLNLGLTAATYRYAINGTSATALPGTITTSANALSTIPIWAAMAV